MVAGLFVAFEGVDGSGKTTQIGRVAEAIKSWEKYQDVILTREPTHRAKGIVRALRTDLDPLSNPELMAQGFVEDRRAHYFGSIRGDLTNRRVVLCDRFSMSTIAYQSLQGVPIEKLIEMHEENLIGTPDITFYLAISADTAIERMRLRSAPKEKFENPSFIRDLVTRYEEIYQMLLEGENPRLNNLLGRVIKLNGEIPMSEVTHSMTNLIEPIYLGNKE
jgi:dTMP kinase